MSTGNTRKRVPIATHKFYHGAHSEEYVFYLTLNIQIKNKIIKKTQVNYFVGNVVIKLRGMEEENHFKNKQLTLNDNEKCF